MTNEAFELFDLWKRQAMFAGGFASLAPAAGFVMATRLARLAVEGGSPTVGGMREAERMMSEKVVAAVEGGAAAARVLTGLATASSPLAAAGVMMSAGEAAMKPAARRVKANARRLSRS